MQHDEANTREGDQGQGCSGDPADGDSAHAPKHRMAERTEQGRRSVEERFHRQAHRFDARHARRSQSRGDL